MAIWHHSKRLTKLKVTSDVKTIDGLILMQLYYHELHIHLRESFAICHPQIVNFYCNYFFILFVVFCLCICILK